jgi:glycine/D-amino acid oxidase-like deaminating enzyme
MYEPLSDAAGPPHVYVRSAPPAPPTQSLEVPRHVPVVVIGAGFTGLSTALHLVESGTDVAVLEAKDIGWGASGRAFGQVVPYLKPGHMRSCATTGRSAASASSTQLLRDRIWCSN